jgi:hypothetical protein
VPGASRSLSTRRCGLTDMLVVPQLTCSTLSQWHITKNGRHFRRAQEPECALSLDELVPAMLLVRLVDTDHPHGCNEAITVTCRGRAR